MLILKKFISVLVLCFALFNLSLAQKVNVTEFEETIENVNRKGMVTTILLDPEQVEKAWLKKLKEFGKVDVSKSIYIVEIALIVGISATPVRIVSTITNNDKGSRIFWSIEMGKTYVSSKDDQEKYHTAEKILHDFGVMLYREDINDQIKDAEKVLSQTVKLQEKKLKQGVDLLSKTEKNKQNKLVLEQKLKENAEELIQLQKDTEQNKLDQNAAAIEVDKVKLSVEAVKAKLLKVE